MKIDDKIRVKVINKYLAGMGRARIVSTFNIDPVTLWRWLKLYQQVGFEGLTDRRNYQKPWNKFSPDFEQNVVALKESNPALTITGATQALTANGISISRKGVWSIWRRYGFAGYVKNKIGNVSDCRKYFCTNPAVQHSIRQVQELLKNGRQKEAVSIINDLPVFPADELLNQAPKSMLSLKRQADLLLAQSGKIPLRIYRKKTKRLRERLEKRGWYYTALRLGIEEGAALTWLEEHAKLRKLITRMRRKARGVRDAWMHFTLFLLEGYAWAGFLRIEEALKCADKCKTIIRRLNQPYFLMGELTSLYYMMGRYREAIRWAKKALEGVGGEYRKDLYASLVGFLTVSGDYNFIPKIIKGEKLAKWGYQTRLILCEALFNLNQGNLSKASACAEQALLQAKQEGIKAFFATATFVLACCYAAFGERRKAENILRKYGRLLKKYHLEKEYFLRKILLGELKIPKRIQAVPNLHLAHLFKQAKRSCRARDYRKVIRFAHGRQLFGLFTRLALFYPEPIIRLLQKGKNPGLPKRLLKLPVFQVDRPIYNLRFLGKFKIFKGDKLMARSRLAPKDSSLLIHLALDETRRLSLLDLYRNFWPGSKQAARNLSHQLIRIKKNLALPSHLIRMRGNYLLWDFLVTTDYRYFQETLAQAKALKEAGEWFYARKEYLRAFNLFRGEPFKKMYDNWSEAMRNKILSVLEQEVRHFVQVCSENNDTDDAKKVLRRICHIVPQSNEMKEMLERLTL